MQNQYWRINLKNCLIINKGNFGRFTFFCKAHLVNKIINKIKNKLEIENKYFFLILESKEIEIIEKVICIIINFIIN